MKKILAFAVVAALSLLAGCGPQAQPSPETSPPAVVSDTPQSSAITITDVEGRETVLEALPERVLAIGSTVRLYTYIAGTEKLCGIEKAQQNQQSGRPYIMANPQLSELPIVGEGFPSDPDAELIMDCEPDVIIAGDIMDTASLDELQAKTGIPVIIIATGSDNRIANETMAKSLTIIGQVIGMEDRAQEVIEFLKDCEEDLEARTKDIPENERPSMYVGALSFKGSHGIEGTAGNSPLLSTINANNVVDSLGKSGSFEIDKEQLLEWDPEILIVDGGGLYLIKEDYAANPSFYNNLSAVKNGKVYLQLPYTNYYNNVETAIADAYFVGSVLYPEAFSDIDPARKADEIYTFMLGAPLYEKMAALTGPYGALDLGA